MAQKSPLGAHRPVIKTVAARAKPVFVHSMFRSGSTYIFNAFRRAGFWSYHEPLHEILLRLGEETDAVIAETAAKVEKLRHPKLDRPYLDEYVPLVSRIAKVFHKSIPYDGFFLDAEEDANNLKSYLALLINAVNKRPVLQFCRSYGRAGWMHRNFDAIGICVWRDPWDQWHSYKVESYFSITNRLILNATNVPPVLKAIRTLVKSGEIHNQDIGEEFRYFARRPLPPEHDYLVFYALWCYSILEVMPVTDCLISINRLSTDDHYQKNIVNALNRLGITGVDFSDCHIFEGIYGSKDIKFHEKIQKRVHAVFEAHGYGKKSLLSLDEMLNVTKVRRRQMRFSAAVSEEIERRHEQIRMAETQLASVYAALAIEESTSSERLRWAQQLDIELNATRQQLGTLTQEHERTTAWAKSLDAELATTRQRLAKLNTEHEKTASWGKKLDAELTTTRKRLVELNTEHEKTATWAKGLDAELATTRQRLAEINTEITNLNRTVTHRDAQIAILNQAVAERDGQVASLEQTIVEREAQVASLNQAASEVGSHVTALEEAGAKRDKQIASLNQTVSERDAQIAALNQALTDRDGQVASRNQTVAERDGQIVELTNETVRRGEWALGQDQQLKEAQAKIAQITSSNSWRITLPLREGRRWLTNPLSQAKRYLRGAAKLGKAVYMRLPLSHQTKTAHRLFLAKHVPGVLRASNGQPISVPVLHMPKAVARPMADLDSVASGINLTTSLQPVVSVIIPIYGKCDYTLRCFASIAANPPSTPFEVIVVDDFSPDNSAEVLQGVDGIRLISNPENQGFIRSCNIGAKAASGQYLHFLNNDTEVTPGWLDELVRTFHEFPGTGLVGSKLVYPDGTLQEAGGIIWQDGNAWNFGRNQDPSLPVYNYAREVDYCSGASIMVSKALFEELGGFDEHYLPAYCEDADLALKIRHRGHRVIYQPLSVVVHYEGVTSGTETTQGTKAYQAENSKKLFERWKGRLQHHQAPGTDVDGAKDRVAKRRVLVLDHCTPTPNQDAGSVTVFNLLLLLREMDFQVTFIPEDNFLYMPDYTSALQRAGIEMFYAPYYTSVEQHLKESGGRYDLVFVFRPGVVERHIKVIHKYSPQAKVLFHTVDLHYLRMSREADLLGDAAKQKAADQMKQRELNAIRAADASIVHSTAELELLRPELPEARIHVFPLITDIRGTDKTFKNRRDVVFVGGYQHTPNVDAVQYFVNDVMPILRRRLPGVRFYAVGSKPPAEIQALASEDVIVTGFVEDLPPLLDRMRVSVAPLRFGAGIKGKIGAAMVVGLPTVATSLAAEGMSLTHGENILVADGAEAFADTVVQLYEDEALWERLSNNGLEFSEKAWGSEAAWATLHHILQDIGIPCARGKYPLRLFSPDGEVKPIQMGIQYHKQKTNQKLQTVGVCRARVEFEQLLLTAPIKDIAALENDLIAQAKGRENFPVRGFCVPCNKTVPFLVDMLSGGQRKGDHWIPNWRERLECPLCKMNNRQRLSATLVSQYLDALNRSGANVYFMEQVTPIYTWAKKAFPGNQIIGSEYLGPEYPGGAVIKGILHEDVMALSFEDGSIDLIVSNDVFEHVPNPACAFSECMRVLRPGGVMLATFPFHSNTDASVTRATLSRDGLTHLLPPIYHGNPVLADGSLVFTDFGWDVLSVLRKSGFSDVGVEVYASESHGHLGSQFVVRARKANTEYQFK